MAKEIDMSNYFDFMDNKLSELQKLRSDEEMYVGDRPLPIVSSGEWPESLAGGQFAVINEMYDDFLHERNAMVQLCFKRLGIFSFGGFGASADTEGNAPFFDDNGGDETFDSPNYIRADGLKSYMMIPINPEEISVNYQINTSEHKTIFFSELATLTGMKLRRFRINSFFPYRISANRKYGTEPIYRPQDYIKWITECMDNKIILAFRAFGELAEPLPYMKCFIEDFQTTLRAHGEVSYTLSICEYIDYRDNVDTRMFVMDGDTLIVSPREDKRTDGRIGLGDFVYVVEGVIFSDKLKKNTFNVGNMTNSLYRLPSDLVSTRLLTNKGLSDYGKKWQQSIRPQDNMVDSVVYNLANLETIDFIAEMVKTEIGIDRSEIWMVVGGDYYSKYRNLDSLSLVLDINQMKNFIQELSPQTLTKSIKIRSMKDNRIGWVDIDQLKKVSL